MSMPETVRSASLGRVRSRSPRPIREALAEEMRRDPRVFIMGEDVAEAGTPFKVLTGLVEEFGPERVIDTPISEAGHHRPRRRRGHDRHAPGGGHHVRRLPRP